MNNKEVIDKHKIGHSSMSSSIQRSKTSADQRTKEKSRTKKEKKSKKKK